MARREAKEVKGEQGGGGEEGKGSSWQLWEGFSSYSGRMSDSKYFTTTKKGEIHELKEELNSPYKVNPDPEGFF